MLELTKGTSLTIAKLINFDSDTFVWGVNVGKALKIAKMCYRYLKSSIKGSSILTQFLFYKFLTLA